MRRLLAVLWLLIPVGLIAFHYGPGQRRVDRDRAAQKVAAARAAEANQDWKAAMNAYAEAVAALPPGDTEPRFKIRLAHAKARMRAGELPEATLDAEGLLEDATAAKVGAELVKEIRTTVGTMHYYLAWLMRLEGAGAEEWTLETEQARQHFRLLAEDAKSAGDAKAEDHQKNLEAVIRLARMDLSELKGLPLPKECQGNCDCSGKCRKQREARIKVAKKPGDAREKVAEDKKQNAGQGNRPEGSGS
jgi:hypothetical protein